MIAIFSRETIILYNSIEHPLLWWLLRGPHTHQGISDFLLTVARYIQYINQIIGPFPNVIIIINKQKLLIKDDPSPKLLYSKSLILADRW